MVKIRLLREILLGDVMGAGPEPKWTLEEPLRLSLSLEKPSVIKTEVKGELA